MFARTKRLKLRRKNGVGLDEGPRTNLRLVALDDRNMCLKAQRASPLFILLQLNLSCFVIGLTQITP